MPDYGNTPPTEGQAALQASPGDEPWVKIMQDAYGKSTTYYENNYRRQYENGIRLFQSKHPTGSKYNSEAYRYRSRIFRPKTRSMVRKNEATATLAFFSSPDVLSVDPVAQGNPLQAASAAIHKELLAYRLDKSIPWFITAIGGLQDALTVGLVCSFQYWCLRTRRVPVTLEGTLPDGTPVSVQSEQDEIIEDKPEVELLPIENVRFDPAAKWYDVVGTSPYLIIQRPMYVRDVLDMMEESGEYAWRQYDKKTILQYRISDDDPMRTARDEQKENPQQQTSQVNEFDTVMVHLNFVSVDGEDYTWYSLKDSLLLTDPRPTREMFKHCDKRGSRPVVIGFTVLETHKAVPDSATKIGEQLQSEANEIVNQRLDNVKFVLNKRWIIRRGANIDVDSLMRNVPGGATMANNVTDDIREVNWQDVTSSAYQEQDRVNVDYDELLGSFAQSSVLTNRRLNETVGGMRMMAQGANVITEYQLRLFSETWMTPVLRQLAKMEAYYETDEVILAIAGQNAQLFQRFGLSEASDSLLKQDLSVSVHVGMGATDPDTRFQRFSQAMAVYSKMALEGPPELDLVAARQEIFGLAGFRDSARFFKPADPRWLQAQKMMQQAQQVAQQEGMRVSRELDNRERTLDNRDHDLDMRELETDIEKRVVKLESGINRQLVKRAARGQDGA